MNSGQWEVNSEQWSVARKNQGQKLICYIGIPPYYQKPDNLWRLSGFLICRANRIGWRYALIFAHLPKEDFPGCRPPAGCCHSRLYHLGGRWPGKVSPEEAWRNRPLLKRRVPPRSFPRHLSPTGAGGGWGSSRKGRLGGDCLSERGGPSKVFFIGGNLKRRGPPRSSPRLCFHQRGVFSGRRKGHR